MVFEIVKAISENPNEVLYGEGVLEIFQMDLVFFALPITITFLLLKISMFLLPKSADLI